MLTSRTWPRATIATESTLAIAPVFGKIGLREPVRAISQIHLGSNTKSMTATHISTLIGDVSGLGTILNYSTFAALHLAAARERAKLLHSATFRVLQTAPPGFGYACSWWVGSSSPSGPFLTHSGSNCRRACPFVRLPLSLGPI